MAVTKYLPLDIIDNMIGSALGSVKALPMLDPVITDSWSAPTDFLTYGVTGDYPSGGVPMPNLNQVDNSTAGVFEYDAGAALWQSINAYTTGSFNALGISAYGYLIVGIYKLGATYSLTAETLKITVAESADSPGVYPILRFRRNVA